MGFEPTALGLGSRCSTAELRPLAYPRLYLAAPCRQSQCTRRARDRLLQVLVQVINQRAGDRLLANYHLRDLPAPGDEVAGVLTTLDLP